MGHYYADMMCNTCGQVRCVCPRTEDRSTDYHWVVGDNYEVMTAIDFERLRNKGGLSTGVAHMQRLYKKHYQKREDAEEAARLACEAAVEATREQLSRLKNILKVQRPWEKK